MFIINYCLNMFRASLCPSPGEQRPCITACGVCAGSTGCGWLQLWGVAYNATPHNCNQPHPVLPAQTPYAVIHGLCSPGDGHNDARNMLRQ